MCGQRPKKQPLVPARAGTVSERGHRKISLGIFRNFESEPRAILLETFQQALSKKESPHSDIRAKNCGPLMLARCGNGLGTWASKNFSWHFSKFRIGTPSNLVGNIPTTTFKKRITSFRHPSEKKDLSSPLGAGTVSERGHRKISPVIFQNFNSEPSAMLLETFQQALLQKESPHSDIRTKKYGHYNF